MGNTPLDHNYDGIQELDNPLPRWWVYLFVSTVIFGIGYLIYFIGYSKTPAQELAAQMTANAPKADDTGQLDTKLTAAFNDPAAVSAGKTIFVAKCAACHGPQGGGLIGPNLTDNSWIHGKGALTDIYKVVTKGVPEKGMLAWETTLKPEEIIQVVAYVKSLKGTNPSNPKPAEGTPVTE